jgi:hypothetical protein
MAPERVARGGVLLDANVERQFSRRRAPEWPTVLGLVGTEADTPSLRLIHISFDAIANALAHRTRTGRRPVPGIVLDSELVRALGRVLAHEIGHVLIGIPGHDRAGLMRPSFGSEELADPDSKPFRLTCDSADRVRRRVGALTAPSPLPAQRESGSLDVERLREIGGESGGASCLAAHPAR